MPRSNLEQQSQAARFSCATTRQGLERTAAASIRPMTSSVVRDTFEDMATARAGDGLDWGLVASNNSFNASACHYWYANGDNANHPAIASKGGAAIYDLIQDASSDRFRYNDNARNGGSGVIRWPARTSRRGRT